ncbi:MAG: Na(+)-translocating NADH-quinone reductase subunit C [Chromatiales bacterium]|nr:Na(+)-translocating NADH-quinone reductase subunit C [Chromatiales bacterium]
MKDRESVANTIRVSFLVCLVCAVVVSTAAVSLRDLQQQNRLEFRQVNILRVAGVYEPGMDLGAAFGRIERRFVAFDTGEYVDMPADFDPLRASRDPELGRPLESDPAGIRRTARVGEVFLLRNDDDQVMRIILPVHGAGLWSTMFGFLALEPDANTIAGIGFYSHGETPGLGGEIENPRWQRLWEGRRLLDDDGNVAIRVVRGAVPEGASNEEHLVDGLTGATITSEGVNQLVRFWVGDQAFGPYLDRVREEYRGEQRAGI